MTRPAVIQPKNPGEVFLGANRYLLVENSEVQRTKMTVLAPAIRTGNSTHADDQIASSVIWDDLTGGIGVINMDEQQSPDRFTDSSLNTLIKDYWTLPPKSHALTWPTPMVSNNNFADRVAGMVSHRGHVYSSLNRTPFRVADLKNPFVEYYDSVGLAWVSTGGTLYTFAADLTADPIVWKDNVWFPCGTDSTNGRLYRYNTTAQTFSAVTNASGGGQIPAARLAVFDEDLYILQANGAVYSTTDNAVSVSLIDRGSVDTFAALTGLAAHRNVAGDPATFVTTEGRLLTHDYFAGKFYPAGIEFNDKNTDNGRGLTVWDGDLWFGKGANLHQVTSGSRVVRGPNTGDGLLKESQGHVVDIDPGLDNYLVYAVSGNPTYGISSLMAYNRRGHHVLVKAAAVLGLGSGTDVFTRADSAATMDGVGKTWTEGPGTWGIASNTAYCAVSVGTKNQSVTRSPDVGSYVGPLYRTVTVTFSTNAAGAQLIFSSDGAGATATYYAIETYASGYQLVWYQAGTRSVLQQYPTTTANADTLAVTMNGAYFSASLNSGAFTFSGTLPVLYPNNVYAGIGTNATTTPRFDNYAIASTYEPISVCHYHAAPQPDQPGLLFFSGGDALGFNDSYSTQMRYVKVFDTTDNPNQFISSDFESSGNVVLPWFDAGLADVQKTGLNLQVRTLSCSATETVTVSYAIDDSASFTQAYTSAGAQTAITSAGVTTLYLDSDRLGTKFYKIRLKVALASGSATLSPVVVFVKLRYLREFETLYSYTMRLDLTQNQPDGTTPASAIVAMDAIVENHLLTQFAYHSGKTDDTKDVLVTTYAGPTGAANDRGGIATVTLVETSAQ